MSKRYEAINVNDLSVEQRNAAFVPDWACAWALVDTNTGRVLGTDHAEPEDKILIRDLSWVAEEMNTLQDRINLVLDAIAHMNEAVMRSEKNQACWVFVDDIEKILKADQ